MAAGMMPDIEYHSIGRYSLVCDVSLASVTVTDFTVKT